MKRIAICAALLAVLAASAAADSVYDLNAMGRDVVPATGTGHLLAGASIANPDVVSSYITSPAASAFADMVVVTVGIAHHTAKSSYSPLALKALGCPYEYEGAGDESLSLTSANTVFPVATVIVPLRVINFFSGYFVEKMGRAELASDGTAYGDIPFSVLYDKESSVFSIPFFLSAAYKKRLAVSGGVVLSYLDSRETREIDYSSEVNEDISDAIDMYATGTSWAIGALLDYDYVRVGGSYRTGTDMSGHEEYSTALSDIWKSRDVDISAPGSFKIGASLVTKSLAVEVDYETSPWSKLKLGDEYISVNDIYRYSLGVTYRGRHVWNARDYPLLLGYYRQPLDRRADEVPETMENGYMAGTSIDIADGRASVILGLEYITRETDGVPGLHEESFGFYISVAAKEAWRMAIDR